MADDEHILELLAAVRDGDESGSPMSNGLLVDRLGWTAVEVAEWLSAARERLLIWGLPGWGNPRPQFNELELTVQGRRLLETRPSNGRAGKRAPSPARSHVLDVKPG
jgi:hypothetical protein